MHHHTHYAIHLIQNCRNSADLAGIERFWKTYQRTNSDDAEAVSEVGEVLREKQNEISKKEAKQYL